MKGREGRWDGEYTSIEGKRYRKGRSREKARSGEEGERKWSITYKRGKEVRKGRWRKESKWRDGVVKGREEGCRVRKEEGREI